MVDNINKKSEHLFTGTVFYRYKIVVSVISFNFISTENYYYSPCHTYKSGWLMFHTPFSTLIIA